MDSSEICPSVSELKGDFSPVALFPATPLASPNRPDVFNQLGIRATLQGIV
jgi:hypothetical protein